MTSLLEKHSPGEPEALRDQRHPWAERADSRMVPQGTGTGRREAAGPQGGAVSGRTASRVRQKGRELLWVTPHLWDFSPGG